MRRSRLHAAIIVATASLSSFTAGCVRFPPLRFGIRLPNWPEWKSMLVADSRFYIPRTTADEPNCDPVLEEALFSGNLDQCWPTISMPLSELVNELPPAPPALVFFVITWRAETESDLEQVAADIAAAGHEPAMDWP